VFDGANDLLTKTNGLSISNSKTVTCAFTFMPVDNAAEEQDVIIFDDYGVGGGGGTGYVRITGGTKIKASFELSNSSPSQAAQLVTGEIVTYGKQFSVAISFDTADSSKSKIYVDGVSQTLATNTVNNIVCEIDMNYVNIGRNRRNANHWLTGSLGELYFNNTYTDLATENPFWDSDTNRPNSVRKVIEDTGVTPAIAMPLMGNDAGNNLGSGGDFTVNSGPYVGARGGSEFWARGADFNGSSWLSKSMSLPSTKTASLVMAVNFDSLSAQVEMFAIKTNTTNHAILFKRSAAGQISFVTYYQPNSFPGVEMTDTTSMSTGNTYLFFISSDAATTNNNHLYVNGVDNSTVAYNNGASTLDLWNNGQVAIASGEATQASSAIDASVQFVYFTTNYIDFSQEANRNKFVDQLGYPRDLTQQIEDGDITNPQVYMKFDPTVSLGTNSGTGGNFTINGTVISGADFTK
jgi:hypothetical protein